MRPCAPHHGPTGSRSKAQPGPRTWRPSPSARHALMVRCLGVGVPTAGTTKSRSNTSGGVVLRSATNLSSSASTRSVKRQPSWGQTLRAEIDTVVLCDSLLRRPLSALRKGSRGRGGGVCTRAEGSGAPRRRPRRAGHRSGPALGLRNWSLGAKLRAAPPEGAGFDEYTYLSRSYGWSYALCLQNSPPGVCRKC
jgi:hypothetical protein